MRRGLLVLALLAVSACGGATTQASDEDRPAPAQSQAIIYRSDAHAYEVTYPAGWHVVGERLTPNLDDPREILALATYEAPAGGNRCVHQPVAALEALGRADALVVVFERHPPWLETGYPPRDTVELRLESGTGRFCVPEPDRLDEWTSFSDAGRAFYVLVAVGADAPAAVRRDVSAIIDSITFQAS